MRVYCVLSLLTGEILYRGASIGMTASALDPGTCYGWGSDSRSAFEDAKRRWVTFQSCV